VSWADDPPDRPGVDGVNRPPGGPDYGCLLAAARRLLDGVAAADAPDEVTRAAAATVIAACESLEPFRVDEPASPAGRRPDLPGRGHPALIPYIEDHHDDSRSHGRVTFTRAHLGGGAAAHGGMIPLLFDDLLGHQATLRSAQYPTRTACLHVDYRRLTPLDVALTARTWIDQVEGRKIVVRGELRCGEDVLSEAHGLFVTPLPVRPYCG
jgi:acyl-coenzyme A thioesterase PaaI-like protein